jgi:dolichyl-phosphate-mannose--protein O-mannosyl transferase
VDAGPPDRDSVAASPVEEDEFDESWEEGDEDQPGPWLTWSGLVRFLTTPIVALAVVALVAGIPRFWELGTPGVDKTGHRVYVFDETYYAKDACLYAGFTLKHCGLTGEGEQSWVHPPLGKWVIAAGIKLFGDTPFGSRFSSAIFGTATVVLIALLALLLFRSILWCYVAGVLGAVESLLFVQSRIALLDIFVAFWIVLGFLFVVLDRRSIQRRTLPAPSPEPALSLGPGAMARSEATTEDRETVQERGTPASAPAPPRRGVPSPLWRPWRFAAGFAFGAAMATKWSGVPALVGALFLMGLWEVTRRSEPGAMGPGELVAGIALGSVILADGFAFGGTFAGKWSGVPGLTVLLLLVIPGLWLLSQVFRPPVPAGPGGVVANLALVGAVFAEGFAVGATVGGKWSGLVPAAGFFGLLVVAGLWERARHRRERRRNPLAEAVKQESFTMLLAMVALPILVYIGSYSGTIDPKTYPEYHPGLGWHFSLPQLAHVTGSMANFHEHLYAYDPKKPDHKAHPYQSVPWTWPYMGRPVAYYYEATHEGKPDEKRSEILGIGNPAIFWSSFLTVPWLLWFLWRRRDWVAGFVLVAILSQYLFWFIPKLSLPKVQFFFYATPIAPFLVLAAVYVLRDVSVITIQGSKARPFLPLVWGYVIAAVALFAWFWPVLTALPISEHWWQRIVWFPSWI